MYKYIPILSLFFLSCSNLQECPDLKYNPSNKLTTLPGGEAYTGRCLVYKNNSKRSIQQYVNGIDYGNWVYYFPSGEIETKGKFRNGLRVGKWRYYYESGNLKQISRYSKIGERSGKWIEYDENGKIINIVDYK